MSSGNENSVEHIKQKIELEKEKLKFLNSFYLPLSSGLVVMVVRPTQVSSRDNAMYFLGGLIIFGFISLERKKVLKEIDLLIKKLEKEG